MYRNSATIEDIYRLALPSETTLLVGEQWLNRSVSWACSLRPSPPAFPKLDGDEFALIDIEDLRGLDPQMRLDRVVRGLQSARVSAIAVLGSVTNTAVRAAKADNIALFQLPDSEPLVQIERRVIRLIVDRAGYIAQRSADLQHQLNHVALDGGGLEKIAELIQAFAQQPLILLRENGSVAAAVGLEFLEKTLYERLLTSLPNITALHSWAATQQQDKLAEAIGVMPISSIPVTMNPSDTQANRTAEVLTSLDSSLETLVLEESTVKNQRIDTHDQSSAKPTSRLNGARLTTLPVHETLVAPILGNDSIRGYCLLLRMEGNAGHEISAVEEIAIRQCTAAAALEWAKQKAIDVAAERMRASFLDELLTSEISDEEAWIQRGASLGYELRRPHVAWIVQAAHIPDWPRPLVRLTEEHSTAPPLSYRDEGVVLFWPIDNPKSGRELKPIAQEFVEQIQATTAGAEIVIGIGRPESRPSQWINSLQQARESWRIGRQWKGNPITYFGDLEFYKLLTALSGNMEASRFYLKTLGKLIDHDVDHNAELVTTLEAFFECHGNLSQTASRLHIHRNTLTYRLERIASITRLDLNDPDARFSLQLALKLHPVMK